MPIFETILVIVAAAAIAVLIVGGLFTYIIHSTNSQSSQESNKSALS